MRLQKLLCSCLFVVSLFFLLTSAVWGQTSATGGLQGTVTDPSGGVVPNVTVTATNTDTGAARTATTGANGDYSIGLLPPGTYKVKFEAAGFKSVEVPSVTVTVTEVAGMNYRLEVASAAQTVVTVEAEAEQVQTTSSTMGSVQSGKSITDLPLESRQYVNLIGLTAGGNAAVQNATALGKGDVTTLVNGAGADQNNYQMDGATINNFGSFEQVAESTTYAAFGVPSPDAVEEFKIQTSAMDASAGRNPGAIVNVVTKSGGNNFHGTAFEFFRNTSLNANDFFLNRTAGLAGTPPKRGVLNQNQFGGTLGGPIKKDKLFFFGSYEQTAQKNGLGSSSISTIAGEPPLTNSGPRTAAAIAAALCPGQFTAAGKTPPAQDIQNPTNSGNETQIALSCTGVATPAVNGGTLATSTPATAGLNPVAVALFNLKNPDGSFYVPGSGLTPNTAAANTVTTGPNPFSGWNLNNAITIPSIYHEYQFVANWDYEINGKNTLSGRYFYARSPTVASFTQSLPDDALDYAPTNHEALLKLTTVVSNNIVNEARVSFQRNFLTDNPQVPFTEDQIGEAVNSPGFGDKIPSLSVGGAFSFGVGSFVWETVLTNQYQAADQLSWTHGKHNTRFGFELERDQWNWRQPSLAVGNGSWPTMADFLVGLAGCSPGTYNSSNVTNFTGAGCSIYNPGATNGSEYSNFAGSASTAQFTTPSGDVHAFRSRAYNAFVQDDFKVFPRLTINIGMRWEFDGNLADANGRISNYWFQPIGLGSVPGGTPATGTLAGWVVPNNFPLPVPAGVIQSNQGILTHNKTPLTDFAPRLGFAWQPTGSDHFVVRGGGGFFYDRVAGDPLSHAYIANAPFAISIGSNALTNYFATDQFPWASSSPTNPAPPVIGQFPVRYATATPAPGGAISSNLNQTSIAENFVTPVTYQYNLNVQYEFLNRWTLEVGYVGSRGIHQNLCVAGCQTGGFPANVAQLVSPSNPVTVACNPAFDATAAQQTALASLGGLPCTGASQTSTQITTNTSGNSALRVPYLGVSSAFPISSTTGQYHYDGLQATVRKALSYGLTAQGTFAYSHSFFTSYVDDPTLAPQLATYSMYRPMRLTLSYSWTIPTPHFITGFMAKAMNGWTVTGVSVIQDGTPLNFTATGGAAYGSPPGVTSTAQFAPGMGIANVYMSGSIGQKVNTGQYFNLSAFCHGASSSWAPNTCAGTGVPNAPNSTATGYGNVPQDFVLGPGQDNWDMSIGKITKVGGIREDALLLFRAEFFNAFNHPQFGNPAIATATPNTFGQITTSTVNPRILQLALKYQF